MFLEYGSGGFVGKIEWGAKRVCGECAAPFYDLLRYPIRCPKCDTEFRPAAKLVRSRATKIKGDRAKAVPAPSGQFGDIPVPGSPPMRATDAVEEDPENEDEDAADDDVEADRDAAA